MQCPGRRLVGRAYVLHLGKPLGNGARYADGLHSGFAGKMGESRIFRERIRHDFAPARECHGAKSVRNQCACDTLAAGTARDQHGKFGTLLIEKEYVSNAKGSMIALGDEAEHLRTRVDLLLDKVWIKMVDVMKKAAVAIVLVRIFENAAKVLTVGREERTNDHSLV